MRRYTVKLTDTAFDDLVDIRQWIAEEGDADTAFAFVDRMQARIAKLEIYPQRGITHPDIRSDIRSIGFEGSYRIFYHVDGSLVWIDRVLSTRRDLSDLP